jgi:hypothetical protein
MKNLRRTVTGLIVVFLVGTIGMAMWGNAAYPPHQPALDALISDAQVIVTQHAGFITFEPVGTTPVTGFVFVPGGRVDYRAYAPVLHQIAAQGYFAAVVQVRINLAFFDDNAPDRVISKYPDIQRWVVGGHSLGGVASAGYVAEHLDMAAGLVLWASYPADEALKDTDLPALVIYGSNDMEGDTQRNLVQARLPASVQFVVIEGGNHAQFGSYGPQAGDRAADISAEEQWMQVVSVTVRFLESLSN